jgi:hypothetical protein
MFLWFLYPLVGFPWSPIATEEKGPPGVLTRKEDGTCTQCNVTLSPRDKSQSVEWMAVDGCEVMRADGIQ